MMTVGTVVVVYNARNNEKCYSRNYIEEQIKKRITNDYATKDVIEASVKKELKNRIIKVVLDKCDN